MKNKRKAFTLAEVLITLIIIGFIAAVLLPALKNAADKTSWAKGLAVNSNIIKNGFERMLALNEADTLDSTPLWSRRYSDEELNNVAKSELKKYFNIEKFEDENEVTYPISEYNGTEYNDISGFRIFLSNGAAINFNYNTPGSFPKDCDSIKEKGGHLCESAAYIVLDVNGKQGPNTLGKDVYGFFLGNDANLYPDGGKDSYFYEEDENFPLWDTENGCQGKKPVHGLTCTARVIEEGYKINY